MGCCIQRSTASAMLPHKQTSDSVDLLSSQISWLRRSVQRLIPFSIDLSKKWSSVYKVMIKWLCVTFLLPFTHSPFCKHREAMLLKYFTEQFSSSANPLCAPAKRLPAVLSASHLSMKASEQLLYCVVALPKALLSYYIHQSATQMLQEINIVTVHRLLHLSRFGRKLGGSRAKVLPSADLLCL